MRVKELSKKQKKLEVPKGMVVLVINDHAYTLKREAAMGVVRKAKELPAFKDKYAILAIAKEQSFFMKRDIYEDPKEFDSMVEEYKRAGFNVYTTYSSEDELKN